MNIKYKMNNYSSENSNVNYKFKRVVSILAKLQ